MGVGVLCTTTPRVAWAAGFAITAQGAAASGKSSAFTAQADDPSALYYNPAGIVQLRTTSVLVGTTVLRPHTDYESTASGNAVTERERYYALPHVYVTQQVGSRLAAGLALFTPFGLSTRWPADWDGRFQVIDVAVRATIVNPALAWQATEWLTIAGGLHHAYLNLAQHRALNLARLVPGAPEGAVSLAGDARGLGFNGGVLIIPSPRWQLGASYRSRINTEVKSGQADFTVPPLFAGTFSDTSIRTELTLPPSLRTGLLMRPSPDWSIEFGATWTGWSTIDRLEIGFANGLPTDVTNFGWHDSMAYSLGAEYRLSPAVRLRGGYLYDLTPIPKDQANPLIPDANRQGISLGVGVATDRWTLDAAYQFLLFRRSKENDFGSWFNSSVPPIDARANGLYRSNAHVIGVSTGYQF